MKFRKKPVVIEAYQWFPGMARDEVFILTGNRPVIKTLEGFMNVSPGDWIITGVKGVKYPCKPDIFEQTYERVEEDAEEN